LIAKCAAMKPSTWAVFCIGTVMWDPTKFLRRAGEWQTPILFGVVDDRSRLACRIVRTLRVPEKRA
jgi:hypothetical protein